MSFDFLEWNKDVWKGIFVGFELILLFLGVFGIFMEIQIGKSSDEVVVNSNTNYTFGKTNNFEGISVSANKLIIGDLTQACIDVSVESVIPSVGDFTGGSFCRDQKLVVDKWVIRVKDVRPERDEAILTKTEITSIPFYMWWVFLVALAIIHLISFKIFRQNNSSG